MAKDVNQLLVFDFGLKQIGIATGSRISGLASDLTVVAAKDGTPTWQDIQIIVEEWKPDLCLVGLPINMDGSESQLSQRARKFANQLHGRFGVKTELIDERLSSFEAKQLAQELGHQGDYNKKPVDALAARILAEQWLSQHS